MPFLRRIIFAFALMPAALAAADLVPLPEPSSGYGAWSGGRYTAAVRHWRQDAEAGDAEAQLYLAFAYRIGKGVEKDMVEAARWYLAAAEQGVAEAQYELGLMYEVGIGVETDHGEANFWYGRALEHGYCPSELNAGGVLGDR